MNGTVEDIVDAKGKGQKVKGEGLFINSICYIGMNFAFLNDKKKAEK